MDRRIELRQLTEILALFLIVQFLGLAIIFFSVPPWAISLVTAPVSTSTSISQVAELLVYMIAASIILVVIFRVYKGAILFKALEAYVVGVPSFFLFLILIGDFAPTLSATASMVVAAALSIALVYAKSRKPWLRNTTTIISSIGMGIIIGMFGFSFGYFLMALIAVYDYVAVFITKHMQVMARALASRNLSFLIGSSDISLVPENTIPRRDRPDAMKAAAELGKRNPSIEKFVKAGAVPMVSQVMLGAGDLAIPLMLAVSAYISFGDFFVPLVIACGAAAGVLGTMYLLKKYMVPLPAIPPLFAFINAALAIALFIKPSIMPGISPLAFLALAVMILLLLYFTLERHPLRSEEPSSGSGRRKPRHA